MKFRRKNWTSPNFWILLTTISLLISVFIYGQYKRDDRIIADDVIGYYAYLPAIFIYHDISMDFINTYKGPHHYNIWVKESPTGGKMVKTSAGLAYLYAPFFFIGHGAAYFTGYDTGGYSLPYRFALMMATLFYLIIGLVFMVKILKRYFNDQVIIMTMLALVFGTNLYFYGTFEAPMAHVYGFCLFAIFIHYTLSWYEKLSWKYTVILGLTAGLIALIRPTNLLIVLFFLLYGISSYNDLGPRSRLLFSKKAHILTMILLAFIVWIPQLLYWKFVTGQYLYYSYGEEERFFFMNPHIIDGLFGFRKGLFLYIPMMMIPIAGIFFLWVDMGLSCFLSKRVLWVCLCLFFL